MGNIVLYCTYIERVYNSPFSLYWPFSNCRSKRILEFMYMFCILRKSVNYLFALDIHIFVSRRKVDEKRFGRSIDKTSFPPKHFILLNQFSMTLSI